MVYAPVARQRSRADRRWHGLDDEPRHRRRGGREARRRDQPDRAVRQRLRRQRRTLRGSRPRRVSDMGFPQIGYQAFKLVAHQRLHELAKRLGGALSGRRHRADRARTDRRTDVPDLDDELHLARRDRAPRLRVGDQAPRRAVRALPGGRRAHGIEISGKRVRKVVEHFDAEPEEVSAWRKILEGTTGTLLRQPAQPATRLERRCRSRRAGALSRCACAIAMRTW